MVRSKKAGDFSTSISDPLAVHFHMRAILGGIITHVGDWARRPKWTTDDKQWAATRLVFILSLCFVSGANDATAQVPQTFSFFDSDDRSTGWLDGATVKKARRRLGQVSSRRVSKTTLQAAQLLYARDYKPIFPPRSGPKLMFDDWVMVEKYGATAWHQLKWQLIADNSFARLNLLLQDDPMLTRGEGITLPPPGFASVSSDLAVSFSDAALFALLEYAVYHDRHAVLAFVDTLFASSRSASQPQLWMLSKDAAIPVEDRNKELDAIELLAAMREMEVERFQLLPASYVRDLLSVYRAWLREGCNREYDDQLGSWFPIYAHLETDRRRFLETAKSVILASDPATVREVVNDNPLLWESWCSAITAKKWVDGEIAHLLASVANGESPDDTFRDSSRARAYRAMADLHVTEASTAVAVSFLRKCGYEDGVHVAYWLAQCSDEDGRIEGVAYLTRLVAGAAPDDFQRRVDFSRARARSEAVAYLAEVALMHDDVRDRVISLFRTVFASEPRSSRIAQDALVALARLSPGDSVEQIRTYMRSQEPWARIAAIRALGYLSQDAQATLQKEVQAALWDGHGPWGFLSQIETLRFVAKMTTASKAVKDDVILLSQQNPGPIGLTATLTLRAIKNHRVSEESGTAVDRRSGPGLKKD